MVQTSTVVAVNVDVEAPDRVRTCHGYEVPYLNATPAPSTSVRKASILDPGATQSRLAGSSPVSSKHTGRDMMASAPRLARTRQDSPRRKLAVDLNARTFALRID